MLDDTREVKKCVPALRHYQMIPFTNRYATLHQSYNNSIQRIQRRILYCLSVQNVMMDQLKSLYTNTDIYKRIILAITQQN